MGAVPQTDGLPHLVDQSATGRQMPSTPRKEGDVGRYLEQLNFDHDLNLPWNERESPSKKRRSPAHDVASAISFLYFQDPSALNRAIEELRNWTDSLASGERKISFLLKRLTIARTGCLKAKRTPRTSASSRSPEKVSPARCSLQIQQPSARPGSPAPKRSEQLPEPASPTLWVKHAPPLSHEMPANDFALPPANVSMPPLKRPRSPNLGDKLRCSSSGRRTRTSRTHGNENDDPISPSMPPPPSMSSSHKHGYNSVNTSFTSNGFNDSFWSNEQKDSQEYPGSPATTVDEDSFFTADRDPCSDVEAHRFGLDGANDTGTEVGKTCASQQTYYGSFPRSQDMEPRLFGGESTVESTRPKQQDLRLSTQSEYEYGPGINASQLKELDRRTASCASATATEAQLLSPPQTDLQPTLHELTGRARVRQIPQDGLSDVFMPHFFLELPLDLRLEAIRVLKCSGMTSATLEAAWSGSRTMDSLHELARAHGLRYERGCTTDFSEHGLAAKMSWSSRRQGRVLNLEVCPPRKDNANAFERMFGRDRFLVVDVPQLIWPPKKTDLDGLGLLILQNVGEMLKQEQRFAGRVWRQFLVQPKKPRRTRKDDESKAVWQVTFFAVRSDEGDVNRLTEIPISEVMDWAVQFAANTDAMQCKMYSRLDLSTSRTIGTIQFKAGQIAFVEDHEPTDDPDDIRFHDNELGPPNSIKTSEVMNDGCSRISIYAMRMIQRELKLEHLPTAVQGRIMGAKGIWFRDEDDTNIDEEPKILIWITKSQIKVRQEAQSLSDPSKLTLNVVRTSIRAHPSFQYADFLPILEDRKVPRPAIEQAVKDSTKAVADNFVKAFPDRLALAEWIDGERKSRQSRARANGIDAIGGFPTSREEQILMMLRSGFDPRFCDYLADQARQSFKLHLSSLRSNFKTPLRSSTMLIGIADPLGVLQPGEIHVGFSTPFEDAKQTRYNLRNLEALVSRLPSLGASDMQRVRCVFHEKLSHLTDVVVFPSRGPRPLASKLQGGDYDGDTFVIIWEPSLVKNFWNAPAPEVEDGPEYFGIEVDRTRMDEMVQKSFNGGFHEQQVLDWIARNTHQRMQPDMLGTITLVYEKVIYHDDGLTSYRARQVLRLHDLMIDATKQGYHLPKRAWDAFSKKHKLQALDNLCEPAHRRFARGMNSEGKFSKAAEAKGTHNISDYIYFDVIEPALKGALQRAMSLGPSGDGTKKADDANIESVFCEMIRNLPPSRTRALALQAKLSSLKKRWGERTSEYFEKRTSPWRHVLEATRADFEAIMPMPDDTMFRVLMYKTGEDPSLWEKLRASCLVSVGASSKLMFSAAGYEVCFLKACAKGVPPPIPVRADMYCTMEQSKRKRKFEGEVEEREEGHDEVMEVGVGALVP